MSTAFGAHLLAPESTMGDLLYLVLLLVCCGATGALIVICDRLRPRDAPPPGPGGIPLGELGRQYGGKP